MKTVEEIDEKIAMFYRAKRESNLTEQQTQNCDSAIQILKWVLGEDDSKEARLQRTRDGEIK